MNVVQTATAVAAPVDSLPDARRRLPTPTDNMADPAIDPRLQQFSSLPPRSLAPQSYAAAPAQPLQHSATPYYLPAANNAQPRPSNIDPAFEQTSPTGPEESHDEDDHDDGELDGYHAPHASPRLANIALLTIVTAPMARPPPASRRTI